MAPETFLRTRDHHIVSISSRGCHHWVVALLLLISPHHLPLLLYLHEGIRTFIYRLWISKWSQFWENIHFWLFRCVNLALYFILVLWVVAFQFSIDYISKIPNLKENLVSTTQSTERPRHFQMETKSSQVYSLRFSFNQIIFSRSIPFFSCLSYVPD